MVGLVIHKNYLFPQSKGISFAGFKEGVAVDEEWMGIYFKGEKVGCSVTKTSWAGDGYDIFEQSIIIFNIRGDKQQVEYQSKTTVDKNFLLKSFDCCLSSGLVNFSLQGKINGKKLDLTIFSKKTKSHSALTLEKIPYLSNNINPYIFKQGLAVGKRYSLSFFDPFTMKISKILIDVVGREELEQAGKKIMTYRLEKIYKGIETSIWVTETGKRLKEETMLGFTLIKESPKTTLSGEWTKCPKEDIITMTAVSTDRLIHNAREVKQLKLKLMNISLEDFNLDEGRQNLTGNILEVIREDPVFWKTFLLPYNKKKLKKYLQPTPFIQSENERIIKQSAVITGGNKDAEQAARMLLNWVYNNLKKKPNVGIPSALEVLDLRAGDCNEHAVLFTALSRSLGIPARTCVGLVYIKDGFYYHAWAEIFLGEWVAVDPVLHQFPADATHVRFESGDLDDQIKILRLVGTLRLEVVDYS